MGWRKDGGGDRLGMLAVDKGSNGGCAGELASVVVSCALRRGGGGGAGHRWRRAWAISACYTPGALLATNGIANNTPVAPSSVRYLRWA